MRVNPGRLHEVRTERLDLDPMSLQFLEATLCQDPMRASALLGAAVPSGWPDIPDVLSMRAHQLVASPELAPWLLRAMRERSTGHFVGHIGFHTAPGPDYLDAYLPGGIELGYTVFAPYRRRGYAREAVIGLIRWAHQAHGVTRFVVSVGPHNHASQRLAASLGFVPIGRHVDEADGEEDVLGLDLGRTDPVW